MSLRGPATQHLHNERAKRASLMGRVGRWSKVSFKILHTLWGFRTCIYILVYLIKTVTNILMGLKIWCQVGGGGPLFSKLPYVREFSNIWFPNCVILGRQNARCVLGVFSNLQQVGDFSIFGSKSKVFQKHMRSQAFFSKIWCYLMGWGRVGTQHGLTCFWVQKFIFWGSGGHKIWVLLGGFIPRRDYALA